MDILIDLKRDRWIEDHIGCCGTCDYYRYGCNNEEGPCYGEAVEPESGCDEWKGGDMSRENRNKERGLARWIKTTVGVWTNDNECSECGYHCVCPDGEEPRFCGNCGCEMENPGRYSSHGEGE